MNFNPYNNPVTDQALFGNSGESNQEKQYCFKELLKVLPFKEIK
jgi:hypothetical protein